MKAFTLALALVVVTLGVVSAAEAKPPGPGGDCDLRFEDWATVGGTDTPLDGTDVGRPYLDCTY